MITQTLFCIILAKFVGGTFDACQDLCQEFAADRRGRGYDLCESAPSACQDSSCRYLYWSTTEAGEPGLIYSLNETDLSEDERSCPLLCEEAVEIVNPPYIFSTHPLSLEDYLSVVAR
jgi:hypothetical protein